MPDEPTLESAGGEADEPVVEPVLGGAPSLLNFEFPNAELVFAVVCAVGVNYGKVARFLGNLVREYGYEPNPVRLSDSLKGLVEELRLPDKLEDSSEFRRIHSRMRAGNAARRRSKRQDLIALAAISQINRQRAREPNGSSRQLPRKAHILLTLKRPEEVDLLRRVYGAGFFLVGIFASEREREMFLRDEYGMTQQDAQTLIRDDEEDQDEFGQRTRKTFHRADVFVRLIENRYKSELARFLDLVFRYPYHTPVPDEHGMFLAYAASLRSAQLGRQVGASIISTAGDVIAVGCNEVPRAGGGAYWPGKGDARDHILKDDSNDLRKQAIAADILNRLNSVLKEGSADIAGRLIESSMLFDITEFGRAVHAEMDAILSCVRSGISISGATLYTTTFPCHNCARHIIAAGLRRVIYIEPYPKSMAGTLHADSMWLGERGKGAGAPKIGFEPFVGIGPRKYADLFAVTLSTGFNIERKDAKGHVIPWTRANGKPRIPMQPVSFLQREQLVAAELDIILNGVDQNEEPR